MGGTIMSAFKLSIPWLIFTSGSASRLRTHPPQQSVEARVVEEGVRPFQLHRGGIDVDDSDGSG